MILFNVLITSSLPNVDGCCHQERVINTGVMSPFLGQGTVFNEHSKYKSKSRQILLKK